MVNEKHPDLNIAGGVSFVEYTKSYEMIMDMAHMSLESLAH